MSEKKKTTVEGLTRRKSISSSWPSASFNQRHKKYRREPKD